MSTGLNGQIRAWGRWAAPEQIVAGGENYRLLQVLKHDFFALTSVYERLGEPDRHSASGGSAKVILKLGRRGDFMGLPLRWLGEALCEHEWRILKRLQGIEGIPKAVGRYGKMGLIYKYIEAGVLAEQREASPEFFDGLGEIIRQIHGRAVAYVDLNKRNNILVGKDGRPYLIDFQISCYLGHRLLGSRRLADRVFDILRQADIYHLCKHRRHFVVTGEDEGQGQEGETISSWISLHRKIAQPLIKLRRRILGYLWSTGSLIGDGTGSTIEQKDALR